MKCEPSAMFLGPAVPLTLNCREEGGAWKTSVRYNKFLGTEGREGPQGQPIPHPVEMGLWGLHYSSPDKHQLFLKRMRGSTDDSQRITENVSSLH